MLKIKKILPLFVLSIFFLSNIFSNFVFAQDDNPKESSCLVCSLPSFEFQTYVNFQVEMLEILQNARIQQKENIARTRRWLFAYGILAINGKNDVSFWKALWNSVRNSISDFIYVVKAVRMTSIILYTMSVETAWGSSFLILAKNRPFVRERKTLQEIDMSIHDIMWDLWMDWVWDENISQEMTVELIRLQQKYSTKFYDKNALFSIFSFSWDDIEYGDLAKVLFKLNSIMKWKIMYSYFSDSSTLTEWGFSLKFNENFFTNLENSYSCADWFSPCNDMREQFKSAVDVMPGIKQWFTESAVIIKKANEELKKADMWFLDWNEDKNLENDLWLSERQISLLRTVYWLDTSKMTKDDWTMFSVLFDTNKSVLKWTDRFLNLLKQPQNQWNKNVENVDFSGGYAVWDHDTMKSVMLDTLQAVVNEKNDQKITVVSSNSLSSTKYFYEIWKMIQYIVENHIWDKDSDGLIKSLWESCESQCSNKWNGNCYAN